MPTAKINRLASVLSLAALALCVASGARAQDASATESDPDLRAELEELKQGQENIQQQLKEIFDLLASRPAAPARPAGPDVRGKEFDLADNAVEGELSARLTLVDFTDYQ